MKVCRETIIDKWTLRTVWVTAALVGGWIFSNPEKFITGGVAADGAFELRDVPAGTYALCFSVGTPYYVEVTKVTVDKNLNGLSFPIPRGATGGPRKLTTIQTPE